MPKTKPLAPDGMKFCSRKNCPSSGHPLPLSDFGFDYSRPDGYDIHCRECKKGFRSNGKNAEYCLKYYRTRMVKDLLLEYPCDPEFREANPTTMHAICKWHGWRVEEAAMNLGLSPSNVNKYKDVPRMQFNDLFLAKNHVKTPEEKAAEKEDRKRDGGPPKDTSKEVKDSIASQIHEIAFKLHKERRIGELVWFLARAYIEGYWLTPYCLKLLRFKKEASRNGHVLEGGLTPEDKVPVYLDAPVRLDATPNPNIVSLVTSVQKKAQELHSTAPDAIIEGNEVTVTGEDGEMMRYTLRDPFLVAKDHMRDAIRTMKLGTNPSRIIKQMEEFLAEHK